MCGMRLRLLVSILAAMLAAGSAFAQQPRGERGGRPGGRDFRPGKVQPGPERRVAEPQRADPRRPERMTPQDRERLRRDIEDANRGMERRR